MLSCLLLQLEGLNFEPGTLNLELQLCCLLWATLELGTLNWRLCRLLWASEKALRDKSAKKRPKIWSIDIKGIILHTEIWFS